MAHADKYTEPGALADWEAVRAELAKLALTTGQIIDNQQLIQRDDGCLKDGAVKPHTVSRELLALMGNYEFLGAYERRPYRTGQLVEWDGKLYVAAEDHAGGDVPDLAKFKLLGLSGCGGAVSGSLPALPSANGGLPNVSVNLPQTVRLNVIVESVRVERLVVENVDIRAFAPPPVTLPPPSNPPGNPSAGTPPPAKIDPATLPEMAVGSDAAVFLNLGTLNTPEGRAVNVRLDGRAVAPPGWEAVCTPPALRVRNVYQVWNVRSRSRSSPSDYQDTYHTEQGKMHYFYTLAEVADFLEGLLPAHERVSEAMARIRAHNDNGSLGTLGVRDLRDDRDTVGVIQVWYNISSAVCGIHSLPCVRDAQAWPQSLPSELVAGELGFQAACAEHDPHLHERYARPLRDMSLTDADGRWLLMMAGSTRTDGFWIDRPHWTRAVKVDKSGRITAYGEPKGGV